MKKRRYSRNIVDKWFSMNSVIVFSILKTKLIVSTETVTLSVCAKTLNTSFYFICLNRTMHTTT